MEEEEDDDAVIFICCFTDGEVSVAVVTIS
jgi:hypothetical protein